MADRLTEAEQNYLYPYIFIVFDCHCPILVFGRFVHHRDAMECRQILGHCANMRMQKNSDDGPYGMSGPDMDRLLDEAWKKNIVLRDVTLRSHQCQVFRIGRYQRQSQYERQAWFEQCTYEPFHAGRHNLEV